MRLLPLLLGAPLLAGTALLPPRLQMLCALLAIIIFGVPHGALDGELARGAMRPHLGRAWLPIFALPYLALSALVLVAWRLAPVSTLAAFLALSVWHFGSEDAAGGSWPDKLLRGGLPVAVPMLAHHAATVGLFTTVIAAPLAGFAAFWTLAAACWLALAVLWTVRALIGRRPNDLLEPGALVTAFLALPPLTAFAVYFVCIHAPAHTAVLVSDERVVRVPDTRAAWRRAMPFTGLTIMLGAALWPLYGGEAAPRLLALTIQGLAALTLPHMMLGKWLASPSATGDASRTRRRVNGPPPAFEERYRWVR